jgi:hypothetical protein
MKTLTLKLDILSYWHAGSGRGAAALADAVVVRDDTGLPYLPGRTVKGLVRDAMDLAEAAGIVARGRTELRLGRATRSGHGRLRVVRASSGRFDLRKPEDLARYKKLPVAIDGRDGDVLSPVQVPDGRHGKGWVKGTMTLDASGSWLIGGTLPARRQLARDKEKGKTGWDRFPFTERHIVWKKAAGGDESGAVVEKDAVPFVVPASSVKGALRHRIAFHSRVIRGAWIWSGKESLEHGTEDERELFGEIRSEEGGRPGRVLLEDARVSPGDGVAFAVFQHVCLDRFTQGPMDGLLFDELAVHGGRIEMAVVLRTEGLSREARQAFSRALDDLCAGRLGIGTGRSHGRFEGSVVWEDGGDWKEQGA